MPSSATVVIFVVVGFVVYSMFRDRLFDSFEMEPFRGAQDIQGGSVPGPAPVLIRQAPVYPEREMIPSGPSPPSHSPSSEEMVVYGPPQASDPYDANQESSAIPETLRHPERAYRPAPSAHHTSIARDSGLASEVSSGPGTRSTEMIQNGGEIMEGVFANDTFEDTQFSSF